MATIFTQTVSDIIDNLSDVIEGGSTWRGSGSAYRGIPGTYPNDDGLFGASPDDTPLTVTADNALTTTTFDVASSNSWASSRWVNENTPSFWALCTTSGGAGNPNIDQARKITGYNNTTKVFTVAPAFSAAPISDDVMAIMQGFKRIPNGVDINAEASGFEGGFDRFFDFQTAPGEWTDHLGDGRRLLKAELNLILRITNRHRAHDHVASAWENMGRLRIVLARGSNPDHRDGTYLAALIPTGVPKIENKDSKKAVITDTYEMFYWIDTSFN